LLGERAEAEAALRVSNSITAKNDLGIMLLNAWTADLLGLNDRAKQERQIVVAFLGPKASDFAIPIPAVAVAVLTKRAEEGEGAIARRWLARALEACGDYDRALAAYTRAIEDKVDERDLLLERGELYLLRRNWKQAAASFRAAVDLKPDDH